MSTTIVLLLIALVVQSLQQIGAHGSDVRLAGSIIHECVTLACFSRGKILEDWRKARVWRQQYVARGIVECRKAVFELLGPEGDCWRHYLGQKFWLWRVVAALWFTTLIVVQGLLHPEYSRVKLPISALACTSGLV